MKTDWLGKDEHRDEAEDGEHAATVTRHEEQLLVDVEPRTVGSVTARKRVETTRHEEVVPRDIEYGEAEHVSPDEQDSGEVLTLPDGSVSIPLFEERLVVRKELVVRERIVIRKRVTTEHHRVEADLRTEHIQVEGDVEPSSDRT